MTGDLQDAVRARKAAAELDQPAFLALADDLAPAADGPLLGLPFAVKDNIDVAGLPTTAGDPTRTTPAAVHAFVVQRLVDAGAVPVGKTNLDQYATGLVGTRSPYGACHSVLSETHVSGGSSSGSAVAVASGIVPLALGTDTAGSGRVPAAFNGLVGWKPTRGLLSTRGVVPACASLDCVTTFTRDVATARQVADVVAAYDEQDPWARPFVPAAGVAERFGVVGVPSGALDLDPLHAEAWERAVARAEERYDVVRVDVEVLLETARLLYGGPWLAERYAAFGAALEVDGPHLDPTVRSIVLPGRDLRAAEVFAGLDRLAGLRRRADALWPGIDALLLPVTPTHPTLAEVAADPVGVNSRLGTYTNMVNLLDLCAVAVPAGTRSDGLPFGVQLLAPAFADRPLLDLAADWTDEEVPAVATPPGTAELVVVGAHLTGEPLNGQLTSRGGVLVRRTRTAPAYRMFEVAGPVPRPGLVPVTGGASYDVEVWRLPVAGLGELLGLVGAPLALGPTTLADGSVVPGFVYAGGFRGVDEPGSDLVAELVDGAGRPVRGWRQR